MESNRYHHKKFRTWEICFFFAFLVVLRHVPYQKFRILLRLNPPHQDGGTYLSWSDLGGVNFIRGCKFYKLTLFYKLKVLTFRDYKLRSNTNIIASVTWHFTPKTFHPETFHPGTFHPTYISPHVRFTPRTFHPTYVSPHVRFTPRMFHPTYISPHVHFTPETCHSELNN